MKRVLSLNGIMFEVYCAYEKSPSHTAYVCFLFCFFFSFFFFFFFCIILDENASHMKKLTVFF